MTPGRILVTGADGFVGTHLLPQLRAAFPGAVIVPTALHPPPGYAALDIARAPDVEALVRDVRPDACVHLAAISAIGAARDDPRHAMEVNHGGTAHLATALLRHAPACALLFASSADVYGTTFATGRALTEDDAPRPMNAYGASKAAAEMLLFALAHEHGLRVVIARPTNHTGPGQARGFVVPDFAASIRDHQATGAPVRTGRLDTARDFLDVRDVCAAYVAMLRAGLAPGTVFNISSGTPRVIGDVLRDMLRLAGVPDAPVESAAGRVRTTDILVASVDSARARAALGWAPRFEWTRTLREVLEARAVAPATLAPSSPPPPP